MEIIDVGLIVVGCAIFGFINLRSTVSTSSGQPLLALGGPYGEAKYMVLMALSVFVGTFGGAGLQNHIGAWAFVAYFAPSFGLATIALFKLRRTRLGGPVPHGLA